MKIITPESNNWLNETITVLQNDGIVLHPTDTAYGLAVDATSIKALRKLNQIKHRDNKPFIMVIRNLTQAKKYAEIDELTERIIREFFPGALALVIPKKARVPDLLTAGIPNIAIRQPDHPVTRTISLSYPHPYTSTSANLSGGPTPYSIQEALNQLDEKFIDLVIDVGKLPPKPTSTMVDLTTDPPKILREGTLVQAIHLSLLKNRIK